MQKCKGIESKRVHQAQLTGRYKQLVLKMVIVSHGKESRISYSVSNLWMAVVCALMAVVLDSLRDNQLKRPDIICENVGPVKYHS